ncbi:hypothetical protein [uncultured Sphingomonas sp.]|uniref:hypothetical protein n=1 Tax=uncultured Sphingomonas sp. TaxID=158754 RepID=UPI0035CC6B38
MTVLSDIQHLHAHQAARARPSTNADVLRAVYQGWDVWPGEERGDRVGMARLPHLTILRDIDVARAGHRPVLTRDMDRHALEAGIWRQLLILPDMPSNDIRSELPPADPTSSDPFAPTRWTVPDREMFLRMVTGHSPRDLAEFIVDLRHQDEALARLILAKDFKAALRLRPDAFDIPWPASVVARWAHNGQRDHLPPVAVAGVIAELSRLAQNIDAHLHLTFDAAGNEIFSRGYLDAIPTLAGPFAAPAAVARLTELAVLSSTALVPPDDVLERLDPASCRAWSEGAASIMAIAVGRAGHDAFEMVRHPDTPQDATFFRDGIARNPRFCPEARYEHGSSLQRGNPALFRGMTYRQHAATGLLTIAAEARVLSERYRSGKDRLPMPRVDRRLERALAAIFYCWIEAGHVRALETALAPVISAKEHQAKKALAPEDRTIDALATGTRFGETWCEDGRVRLTDMSDHGEEGYSAGYHVHLWFDDAGNDIGSFQRHQRVAVARNRRLLRHGHPIEGRLATVPRPPSVATRGKPTIDPVLQRRRLSHVMRMQASSAAPIVAQNCAMMLLPPATDQIHLVNSAPHRWRYPDSPQGESSGSA